MGHQVHVITNRASGQPSLEEMEGIQVHRVNNPFNLNAFKKLRSINDGDIPPIIHTHATCGIFLGLLGPLLQKPFVSQVHGTTLSHYMPVRMELGSMNLDYRAPKLGYYYLRERLLWSRAARIACVSQTIQNDLVSHYNINRKKISVVYNGVDTELFRPIPNPTVPAELKGFEDKKIILYVGHFGPRKGILYLIRALREVIREVPNAALVCIGGVPIWLGHSDYWERLAKEVDRNQLRGKVLLLDRVPNGYLPTYYSLANVFALPSYYEAFAKVVIEAMACSRPVVATNSGGVKELVRNGETGFLIRYASVHELADTLISLLQDDSTCKAYGKRGREIVLKHFTWESVAKRLESVYEKIWTQTGAHLN
jgi:glycosyltransferase involved in cell wall biosynthesis